jgi:hypothetical protein
MSDNRKFISELIERIEVSQGNIRLLLKRPKTESVSKADEAALLGAKSHIDVAWMPNSHGSLAVVDESQARGNESHRTLVQAIVRAHAWVKLLTEGGHTSLESLAASTRMHPKVVRKSVRLAFLSPRIAEAILLGQHSKSVLTRTLLHDAHLLSWIEQMRQVDRPPNILDGPSN